MAKQPSKPPSFEEHFNKREEVPSKEKEIEVKIASTETVLLVRDVLKRYATEFPLNRSRVMRAIGQPSHSIDAYFSPTRKVPVSKLYELMKLFGVEDIQRFVEAPNMNSSHSYINKMKKAAKENGLMENPPKGGH